ncbi:hypothetical protein [Chelatococcus reniformis]|uniref:Uncharacterized protein n=1 Tax=Chelatococcus reniformis TaxID=1494448 RepID=A0A916UXS5_9HYPH|nr:hypothetical protein [Chelatococcus reniformis]GGC90504.1 hypothetical protein GCM10010994_55410 [Chelatococcus reniformis]
MGQNIDPLFGGHLRSLVQRYLRAFDLIAVFVTEMSSAGSVRIDIVRDPARRLADLRNGNQQAVEVGPVYWMAAAKTEAVASRLGRPLSAWFRASPDEANAAITAAAKAARSPLTAHNIVADRVCAALRRVDELIAERQRSGALAEVNRAYRSQRVDAKILGGRAKTYAEFLSSVKLQAVDELAARVLRANAKRPTGDSAEA